LYLLRGKIASSREGEITSLRGEKRKTLYGITRRRKQEEVYMKKSRVFFKGKERY